MLRRTFLKMAELVGIPLKKEITVQPNPPHNSLQMPRLNRMPERIYAEVWKERNKRVPGVNSGFTYLEWILCPSGMQHPPPVSEKDAEVAASIIQWLGTNCGYHFMLRCEDKIKKENKKWTPYKE